MGFGVFMGFWVFFGDFMVFLRDFGFLEVIFGFF